MIATTLDSVDGYTEAAKDADNGRLGAMFTARAGERRQVPQSREHLKAFTGFMQADAYAGFERLYEPDCKPGPITPVAWWAHARRKLHDVYQADPSSVAAEGLRTIRALYEVERGIAQDPHDDGRKAGKLSKRTALDFFS